MENNIYLDLHVNYYLTKYPRTLLSPTLSTRTEVQLCYRLIAQHNFNLLGDILFLYKNMFQSLLGLIKAG